METLGDRCAQLGFIQRLEGVAASPPVMQSAYGQLCSFAFIFHGLWMTGCGICEGL